MTTAPRTLGQASLSYFARGEIRVTATDGTQFNSVPKLTALRPLSQQWEEFRFKTPEKYSLHYDTMLDKPAADMTCSNSEGAFHRTSPPPTAAIPNDRGIHCVITDSQLHTLYKEGKDNHDTIPDAKHSKQAFDDILNAHPLLIRAWSMNRMYRPRLKERFRSIFNTLSIVSNAEYEKERDVVVRFDEWRQLDKLLMLNELVAALNTQLYVVVDGQGNYTGAWCRFQGPEMRLPKGNREVAVKRAVAWANWVGMEEDR